jgi:hypothetical protein
MIDHAGRTHGRLFQRRTSLVEASSPAARALAEHAFRVVRGGAAERAAFHASYVSVAGDPGVDGIEVITELRRAVLTVEACEAAGLPLPDLDELTDALAPFRNQITVVARVRFHPQNGYTSMPRLDVRLGTGFSMQPALDVRAEPFDACDTLRDGHPLICGAVVEATFRAAEERAIQTLVIHVNNVYLMVATVDLTRML